MGVQIPPSRPWTFHFLNGLLVALAQDWPMASKEPTLPHSADGSLLPLRGLS